MKTSRVFAILAALAGGAMAQSALADSLSGAYLAGRNAELNGDFDDAARYFSRVIMLEPRNGDLLESLILSQVLAGDMDAATSIARQMDVDGVPSQAAPMVILANLASDGAYDEIISRSRSTETGLGPLVDGLVRAWAHIGAGDQNTAMAAFDDLAQQQGLRGFALYHKALALAQAEDYAAAEAIFAEDADGLVQLTRRGAMARAEILSQLGRNDDAIDVLDTAFGTATDPGLVALRAALDADEQVPFSHIRTPNEGLSEVFFSIAAALRGEAQPDYTLLYVRTALSLRPSHTDALLFAADLLDEMEQYELAIETYEAMPRDHVDYHAAELGRIEALRALGRLDTAIEALTNLAKTHGDLAIVHSTLGNLYRQQSRFEEAAGAYDRALDLTPQDARSRWFLLYARGIAHERQGLWEQAEADFRAALEIEPDQPRVLNYLGYSLVEKQIKLDEALEMIERAVAGQPNSGYIVDSLGWVLYRLGRYDEAVVQMERAVELMPIDPVVNDHLGDVYWAVGRTREAEFQWSRALSFIDPEDTDGEADPDRIRRKLDVGLDQVLSEEGAPPLRVAHED